VNPPRLLADHDLNEHIISAHGRVAISHDINTMPASAYARVVKGLPMPGLLMVRQSRPVSDVIESLVLIVSVSGADEWSGVVCFLPL
jgi:hypothetical protein